MRKRLTTSIEANALKALDIKIIQSDRFIDRSTYFEFLLQLLPFIPDDITPDTDIKSVIRKIYENSGAGAGEEPQTAPEPPAADPQGYSGEDLEIIKMTKNFKHKTTAKETTK